MNRFQSTAIVDLQVIQEVHLLSDVFIREMSSYHLVLFPLFLELVPTGHSVSVVWLISIESRVEPGEESSYFRMPLTMSLLFFMMSLASCRARL